MNEYTIFTRTSTPNDPRVRWLKQIEVAATSKPDALRKFSSRRNLNPAKGFVIDSTTACVPLVVTAGFTDVETLFLAWPSDKIDFDHYGFDGLFVAAV